MNTIGAKLRRILAILVLGVMLCSATPWYSASSIAAPLDNSDRPKPNIERENPGLLYSDSPNDEPKLPLVEGPEETVEIPSRRQRVVKRSDPDEKILEKTSKAFEQGSEFIPGSDLLN